MEQIFKMAGNAAAHAVWSISDGEVLIPLLSFLKPDNTSQMQRLMFSDSDEAMAYARKQQENNGADAKGTVFIYDSFIHDDGQKVDALRVEVRGYGECALGCTFALPYRPPKEGVGFAVYRLALVECPSEHRAVVQEHMDAFFDGVDGNEMAAKVWKKHFRNASPLVKKEESAEEFAEEDWQLLCLAPYLVFLTVAAADGTIDQKEVKALGELLSKPVVHPSAILQQVLGETRGNVQQIITLILEKGWNTIEVLEQVRTVVDSTMEENAGFMFKLCLMAIGQQVAEASGGGFLGKGKKVSQEEMGALAAINQALGVL